MAEMGLTPTDRWHLLGKHGCHYVDSADFVEIREFDERELTHPEWGTLGVPSDPGGPDARWCRHCEDTIDEMRSRRYNTIGKLKSVVPYRDISWETADAAGDCPWCGKADSATRYDEDLDESVCPACAWKYNHGPDVENPPETDQRREKRLTSSIRFDIRTTRATPIGRRRNPRRLRPANRPASAQPTNSDRTSK
jgi:hypothetical protein